MSGIDVIIAMPKKVAPGIRSFTPYQIMYNILLISILFGAVGAPIITINGLQPHIIRNAYAQEADDLWYVGEGAKQQLWVKYRIQELDTNNGRQFEMTIWFKEQDEEGAWIAPTWVVYQGQLINGTLRLENNLAPVTAGANVPQEMNPYLGAYRGSLQWLEGFTTKREPLSLTQLSWGKIAAIGGAEVKPMGTEKVTVPAGEYDTTVVGWFKGVQNRIWIMNEFPYPVKAETFAEVTTGQPPTLFAFELLDTGTGQPPAPELTEFAPEPPLEQATGRGTYTVNLDWTPKSIEPGSEVTFAISFTDSNGNPVERVNYDFAAKDANGVVIQELTEQNTDPNTGSGEQTVKFDEEGLAQISVTINTVEGRLAGGQAGFVETSDFNIVVVPEFPFGLAAVIAAAMLGLIIVLSRQRRITL